AQRVLGTLTRQVAVEERGAYEADLVLAVLDVLLDGLADRLLERGADRAARVLVQLEGLLRLRLADHDGRAVLAGAVGRLDEFGVLRRLPGAGLVGLDDRVADAAGRGQDAHDRKGDHELPLGLRLLRLPLALLAQPLPGRRLRRLAVPLAHGDVSTKDAH